MTFFRFARGFTAGLGLTVALICILSLADTIARNI